VVFLIRGHWRIPIGLVRYLSKIFLIQQCTSNTFYYFSSIDFNLIIKAMNSTTLVYAIVFINLACVLYTIGVWAERFQRRLKWWHTYFFISGFICDTIGTTAMSLISGSLFRLTFHGITGNIAILLMLFHAIWAIVVLAKKNEKMIINFHRFSIVVWIVWLVPMISGMVFGAIH